MSDMEGCVCVYVCVVASFVSNSVIPWTVAHQALQSMGFSRQEYWSVLPCSLGISNFLEVISSLSHSIVFLYFCVLITQKGFLISPCYSLELCIQILVFFLFSFAFHYSSFSAICKAGNCFTVLHFFFLGMVLITASCIMSWTSVHRSVKGVFFCLSEICKIEKGKTSLVNNQSEMVILWSRFK